jgi:hypothetical protein
MATLTRSEYLASLVEIIDLASWPDPPNKSAMSTLLQHITDAQTKNTQGIPGILWKFSVPDIQKYLQLSGNNSVLRQPPHLSGGSKSLDTNLRNWSACETRLASGFNLAQQIGSHLSAEPQNTAAQLALHMMLKAQRNTINSCCKLAICVTEQLLSYDPSNQPDIQGIQSRIGLAAISLLRQSQLNDVRTAILAACSNLEETTGRQKAMILSAARDDVESLQGRSHQ